MSVHLQLRGQPGVHQRLTDMTQTYFEALAQSPAAAGPACRPAPFQVLNKLVLLVRTGCARGVTGAARCGRRAPWCERRAAGMP